MQRAAAQRLDIELVVLADRSVTPSDGTAAVLDTTDERSTAASAATIVRPGDVLMAYEGSQAMVEAIAPIAAAHPASAFVVNLFRPEPGLVPAPVARGRKQPLRPAAARHLPPNLVVTAETELRAELARGLGIPCAGPFRRSTARALVMRPNPTAIAMNGRPMPSAYTSPRNAPRGSVLSALFGCHRQIRQS